MYVGTACVPLLKNSDSIAEGIKGNIYIFPLVTGVANACAYIYVCVRSAQNVRMKRMEA